MHVRTRRQFLRAAVSGVVAGGALGRTPAWAREVQGPAAPGAVPARSALERFELAGLVERFRKHQLARPLGWRATPLTRDAYLDLAGGIARAFAAQQDARGAIIDPFEGRERQYATPAFALAAARPALARNQRDLLEQAMKAMDAATADLASGKAADGHADFYTLLLMQAERELAGRAAPARLAAWRAALAAIVPKETYQVQPDQPALSNWNLVAASGEWLRRRAGLSPDAAWVEASLARQLPLFTTNGMYRDPGDPLPYDLFARLHAGVLIEEGYAGAHAGQLSELLDRGAWSSLLMQSPHGEVPTGGRSSLHQWNEAAQVAVFEMAARRQVLRGDHAGAGAFKRAARLAFASLRRWVRPTGDLWIVKNRFEPAQRHGYEPYSFHSQYNLLAAAHLVVAYLAAEDRIPERPCPAELGGFAFALWPAFHKVFLNASGHYVEMDTAGDPRYNPSGIVRIHHHEVEPQILSDGVAPACGYQVPRPPARGLALGPAWQDHEGRWHDLAGHGADSRMEVALTVSHASPERVECDVIWRGALRGGATAVRQSLFLTPASLTLTTAVEGEIANLRLHVPLLLTDGRGRYAVEVSGRRASVRSPGGSGFVFEVGGSDAPLVRLGAEEAMRAGFMDAAVLETGGRSVRCVVRPA
jgi:hypothetical protein